MFDITGDEIRYNRIPFAKIEGQTSPTQRDEAQKALLGCPDDPDEWCSPKELNKQKEQSFEEGAEDMKDRIDLPRMITLMEDAISTLEAIEDDDHSHLIGQLRAAINLAKS